jgi:hypothetical protein
MHVSSNPFEPDADCRNNIIASNVRCRKDSAAHEMEQSEKFLSRSGDLFPNFVLDAQTTGTERP